MAYTHAHWGLALSATFPTNILTLIHCSTHTTLIPAQPQLPLLHVNLLPPEKDLHSAPRCSPPWDQSAWTPRPPQPTTTTTEVQLTKHWLSPSRSLQNTNPELHTQATEPWSSGADLIRQGVSSAVRGYSGGGCCCCCCCCFCCGVLFLSLSLSLSLRRRSASLTTGLYSTRAFLGCLILMPSCLYELKCCLNSNGNIIRIVCLYVCL